MVYPAGTKFRLNRTYLGNTYTGARVDAQHIHWTTKNGQPYDSMSNWDDSSIKSSIELGELEIINDVNTTTNVVKGGPCPLTTESGFPCELKAGHYTDCMVLKSTNPLAAPTGVSVDEINMLARGGTYVGVTIANPLNDNSLSELDIATLAAGPWLSRKARKERK